MAREGEREETLMCKRYMDWLPLTCPQLGTWPLTQACALTGNRTGDLWVCRPALNPLSHTSQGKIISFYLLIKGGNKMFPFEDFFHRGNKKKSLRERSSEQGR